MKFTQSAVSKGIQYSAGYLKIIRRKKKKKNVKKKKKGKTIGKKNRKKKKKWNKSENNLQSREKGKIKE